MPRPRRNRRSPGLVCWPCGSEANSGTVAWTTRTPSIAACVLLMVHELVGGKSELQLMIGGL